MANVVTDNLRKTAISYNKKSKCKHQLILITFTIIGKLKSPKKIAENAAKRMVQKDAKTSNKKGEGYGFLLAKSMIIMNAEILKERMKPENIQDNIGRDQWDYSNDKIIGTGRGLNWEVVNKEYNEKLIGSTGKFQETDDTFMRASGPAGIDSLEIKSNAEKNFNKTDNQADISRSIDQRNIAALEQEYSK